MIRDLVSGRMLKARLSQPLDEMWDRRLHVKTFGYREGRGEWGTRGWASHYQPASYSDLMRLFKAVGVDRYDSVVDVGSGLGRACFAASFLGAGQVVGVELLPDLVALAEANRWDSRLAHKDIRFVCTDALDHDYAGTTLLYLFHPVSEQVLWEVMDKVRRDRSAAGGGRFRVAYLNPVFEKVLDDAFWLKRAFDLPARRNPLGGESYPAAVWEAIG